MSVLPKSLLAVLLGGAALHAFAGTEADIDVVYGDDIARRGEISAELATRWAQTARTSEFGGRALWQAVAELGYGLSDNFNVGIKLPATHAGGSWYGHGAYLEAKYLAPRANEGFYWGAEVEAGSIKPIGEERAVVVEAFPILGYRSGRWHLIGNPGLEYSSEGEDRGVAFAPKVKLSYRLNDEHAVGVEYHVDAGKFGEFTPRRRRSEMAYLIWDGKLASQPFSIALGHGTTGASDRWAVRIGIELDD